MKRLARFLRFLMLILAPLALTAGPDAYALTTGNIKGMTVDEGGLSIPGVNITLTSENMIGGARQATTDANGRFIFAGLAPGIYEVTAEKPGFSTVRNPGITVLIGRDVRLVIEMPLEGMGDEIVVTDSKPTIDTESTSKGEVLSKEFLDRVPTGRNYQSAVSAAPGVIGGGNPNVGGANYNENSYLIDGINITDPVTGTFSLNFNFDAIEQLEVLTGAFDPEYPQNLGGVINIVTETGGNTLEFDTSLWGSSANWSPKIDARYSADGAELAPTGFDSQYSNYQLNAKISGPIIRDKAWFIVSYSTERSLIANVGIDLPRDYEGHYIYTKLTFQPNPSHRLSLIGQSDPTTIDNTNQSDRFVQPSAQSRQAQGGWLLSPQWDWYINPEVFVETKATIQKSFINASSVPCTHNKDLGYNPCEPGEVENSTDLYTPGRIGLNNAFDRDNTVFFQFDDRWRYRFESKLSVLQRELAGTHDIKMGVEGDYLFWNWIVGVNGNAYYYDLNLVYSDPDTLSNYYYAETTNPFHLQQRALHFGGFVQDVYKPVDNLTFRYGVRYDWADNRNDQDISVIRLGVFGPRFYVAWDPWGDEKTVIRGGYGRFNSLGNLGLANLLSSSNIGQKFYVGEVFGNYFSEPGQMAFDVPIENLTTAADYITAPHSDEVTIGAQRELVQDLAFGSSFTAKFTRNNFAQDETNVIWDEDGFSQLGYRNGESDLYYRLRTPTVARRDYYQTDVQLAKNFADRWLMQSTYSYVISRGTILDSNSASLSIPSQLEYAYGNLSTDIRHQVKINAAYDIPNDPWTTTIGTSLQYYSGYPVSRYYYSAAFGQAYILQAPQGTYDRLEPEYYLNFQVQQNFDVRKGQLVATAMLLNAINAQQATSVSGSALYYDNRWIITTRQTPMQLQLSIGYEF